MPSVEEKRGKILAYDQLKTKYYKMFKNICAIIWCHWQQWDSLFQNNSSLRLNQKKFEKLKYEKQQQQQLFEDTGRLQGSQGVGGLRSQESEKPKGENLRLGVAFTLEKLTNCEVAKKVEV